MFTYKLKYVLFLFIFQGHDCQRRIQNGIRMYLYKKYLVRNKNNSTVLDFDRAWQPHTVRDPVYLLKASVSPQNYDAWLCGGAIVSEWYIVTSAACVTDVVHLYAIAGYKVYVKPREIHTDECTRRLKKKVTLICTPKDYVLDRDKREVWSLMDIAVVKVDSAYDFSDPKYLQHCTFKPNKIEINYEPKYQEPGIDAFVLGWGHTKEYRQKDNPADLNTHFVHFASTLIIDKTKCKEGYKDYEGMDTVIDKYMICTDKTGKLGQSGILNEKSKPTAEGCAPYQQQQTLRGEMICVNADAAEEQTVAVYRKNRNPVNLTVDANQNPYNMKNERNNSAVGANSTLNATLTKTIHKTVINSRRSFTRRNGICQNDHGGPLVAWIGRSEKLIGVATAFQLDENLNCIGPYLFTSTQCSGAFLNCIITSDGPDRNRRRDDENCANFTRETGLTIDEKHISWKDHPDGPAENEKKTTHPLPAYTDTNATKYLMNSTEEKNIKLQHNNTIKLVNINITDSLENTKSTKAKSDSAPRNSTTLPS